MKRLNPLRTKLGQRFVFWLINRRWMQDYPDLQRDLCHLAGWRFFRPVSRGEPHVRPA